MSRNVPALAKNAFYVIRPDFPVTKSGSRRFDDDGVISFATDAADASEVIEWDVSLEHRPVAEHDRLIGVAVHREVFVTVVCQGH